MRVKGKNGTSIEIITQKIKRELRKEYPTIGKHDKKDKVRNRFKSGSLTVKDWNNIEVGMRFIRDIIMGKYVYFWNIRCWKIFLYKIINFKI